MYVLAAAIVGFSLGSLFVTLRTVYRLAPKWFSVVSALLLGLLFFDLTRIVTRPLTPLSFSRVDFIALVIWSLGYLVVFGRQGRVFRYAVIRVKDKTLVALGILLAICFATLGTVEVIHHHETGSWFAYRYLRVSDNWGAGDVLYFGHITYRTSTSDWFIQEEVLLSSDPEDEGEVRRFTAALNKTGWTGAGAVRGQPAFKRQRSQPSFAKWYKLYSVNTIKFEPFERSDLAQGSQVQIIAPKHMVALGSAPFERRTDTTEGERIYVQLVATPYEDDALQIQILNPVLRNPIGSFLMDVSVWSPLKWILATLCGVFAERIRKDVFAPAMDRTVRRIRMARRKRRLRGKQRRTSVKDG